MRMGRGCFRRTGVQALLLLLLIGPAALPPRALAATDAADVSAINGLYVALGSPTIPGWTANGGDPCGEGWQGVVCIGSNIDSIIFNAANLGGQLGSLGNFTSITTINLSNNNVGGTIPEDLPVTVRAGRFGEVYARRRRPRQPSAAGEEGDSATAATAARRLLPPPALGPLQHTRTT